MNTHNTDTQANTSTMTAIRTLPMRGRGATLPCSMRNKLLQLADLYGRAKVRQDLIALNEDVGVIDINNMLGHMILDPEYRFSKRSLYLLRKLYQAHYVAAEPLTPEHEAQAMPVEPAPARLPSTPPPPMPGESSDLNALGSLLNDLINKLVSERLHKLLIECQPSSQKSS